MTHDPSVPDCRWQALIGGSNFDFQFTPPPNHNIQGVNGGTIWRHFTAKCYKARVLGARPSSLKSFPPPSKIFFFFLRIHVNFKVFDLKWSPLKWFRILRQGHKILSISASSFKYHENPDILCFNMTLTNHFHFSTKFFRIRKWTKWLICLNSNHYWN